MAALQTVMNTAPALTMTSEGIPYTRLTCPFCQWIDAQGDILTWADLYAKFLEHRDNEKVLRFCFWVRWQIPQVLTDNQKLRFTQAICQSKRLIQKAWRIRQAGFGFDDLTQEEIDYVRGILNA